MFKPFIGITAYHRVWPESGWEYDVSYAPNTRAIEKAGGLPILIPTGLSEENLRALYDCLDGVMLPGGCDVEPVRYGAKPHPLIGITDVHRDETELALAKWSIDEDQPVFGICRGHQVLNVALGGTLVQDIQAVLETDLRHDNPNTIPRSFRAHDVRINESSRLARILGTTQVSVNSLHHQSVETNAPSATITAYAPDGVVEALEVPDKFFAMSVQWHPEDLTDDPQMMRLFESFVNAARERRKH